MNCFTLQSSVGGVGGREPDVIGPFREQQSYCNAAFMTFRNIELERGFCFGAVIVFQVGVESFQQVSFPAPSRPRRHSRKRVGVGWQGQFGLPLPIRLSNSNGAGAEASRRPRAVAARPALRAPARAAGRRPRTRRPGSRALCPLAAPRTLMTLRFPTASPTKCRACRGNMARHLITGPNGHRAEAPGGTGERARAGVSGAHPTPPSAGSRPGRPRHPRSPSAR